MIRKLYLELRWVFLPLPLFLIALTLEYTYAAQHTWMLAYSDQNGFGVETWPNPPKPEDYEKDLQEFRKEHPQGRIISLKEQPSSFFLGFDGLVRAFLPYMVILLCGGGILCEKAHGTASFMLSLPARRASWLWSRAGALLFLTFLTAILTCVAAFIIAMSISIPGHWSWLFTESFRLTLLAAPWIGVTMFVQSLLSGRFDTTGETVIATLITIALAGVTDLALASGKLDILPEPAFSSAFKWYVDLASNEMGHFSLISTVLITYTMGIGGLLLAVRRFERMDF